MTTNVFENNSDQSNAPVDPLAYVAEKFKNEQGELDIAKLAKAKLDADNHIKNLENEANELRGEVKTRIGLEEFLTKMGNQPPPSDPNKQSNQSPPNDPTPVDIEKLIDEHLTKAESNRIKQSNLNAVNNKLNEIWGADASSKFRSTANELGLSVKDLQEIAERSPEAFFRVTNIKDTNDTPSVGSLPRSSTVVNPDGSSGVRNDKYYRALKKSNPNLYFSAKTQVQMHQDAAAMGEKFFL